MRQCSAEHARVGHKPLRVLVSQWTALSAGGDVIVAAFLKRFPPAISFRHRLGFASRWVTFVLHILMHFDVLYGDLLYAVLESLRTASVIAMPLAAATALVVSAHPAVVLGPPSGWPQLPHPPAAGPRTPQERTTGPHLARPGSGA